MEDCAKFKPVVPMLQRAFGAAMCLAVCLALVSCNEQPAASGVSPAGSKGQGSPQGPEEVRIGYFANVTHAQAVLGVASGDFAKAVEPATLSTRLFNAGPSLIEAVFAGEIDIGYIGPGPALSGFEKSRGEGLRVIAGAAANGVVIVARPDAGISSMADLVGKRIATPQLGNTQDIAARHYLIHELKQTDADNVLPVPNAEQLGLMERGQIDAAWVPEPWGARLELEGGARVIAEERDLWPAGEFILTLVIASPEFLAAHPDVVENFLRAHVSWTQQLQREPTAHLSALQEALSSLTGQSLDARVLERAVSRVSFTTSPSRETLETLSGWALDLGFARSKPDIGEVVDSSILARIEGAAAGGGAP